VVQQSEDEPPKAQYDDREPAICRPHSLPGIHALDNITVNDILVPRSEVDGINLDDPIEEIIEQLRHNKRTRLPVFHSDINQVEAVLNTRQIGHLLPDASLTLEALLAASREPYFVPESTPATATAEFPQTATPPGHGGGRVRRSAGHRHPGRHSRRNRRRVRKPAKPEQPAHPPQADGRLVIDGAASIRELNKSLGWHLPSDGPKTLNGLVTEALETIPESAVCLKIGRYRLEILETEDNRVTRVLIWQTTPMPVVI
jgi:Mg2+/Co2+ transporter CorB